MIILHSYEHVHRLLTQIRTMHFSIQSSNTVFQSTATPPDMLPFRRKVDEVIQHYQENGVRWTISGWYKPGMKGTDEQVSIAPKVVNAQWLYSHGGWTSYRRYNYASKHGTYHGRSKLNNTFSKIR